MEPYRFQSARELFECAREASRDAERIRRQLEAMESRALSLGGGSFEPRVSSTPTGGTMERRVGALIDMEGRLRERQEDDYALMDFACSVLYGGDGDAGLWALVGWRADALWHHYLGGRTWAATGVLLGYTEQHVWREAQVALDVCDAWGIADVMRGRGNATD